MTFKPPEAGELDLLATVEEYRPDGTYDDNGQPVASWVTVGQEYVKREGLSGRALQVARQVYEAASHNIYCRYNADLTRSCRFVIGGVYYVVGWIDVENLQWMRCTAEEAWPQGAAP